MGHMYGPKYNGYVCGYQMKYNVNIMLFPVEIYLSPVETHCSNVDYFVPDENNETKGLSDDAMNRLMIYCYRNLNQHTNRLSHLQTRVFSLIFMFLC